MSMCKGDGAMAVSVVAGIAAAGDVSHARRAWWLCW